MMTLHDRTTSVNHHSIKGARVFAGLQLLFLVLNHSEKQWKMPPREWAMAKAQFAVLFGERFTRAMAG
jgi:transposase-like protein